MAYTYKAYSSNNIWNMRAGSNTGSISPAEIPILSHGSSVFEIAITVGTDSFRGILTGSFQYQEPALLASQVSGVATSTTIYLNGQLNEFQSWSNPISLSSATDPTFNDQLSWLTGDDLFIGSSTVALRDWVRGENGNDKFFGYGDEQDGDYFYGGSGIDTSIYRGNASEYKILPSSTIWDCIKSDGSRLSGLIVTDQTAKRDGLDNLVDVERLQFNDTNIALDYQAGGHAGQAYRLYKGVLGREGEPGGLGYVMNRLDQGETLKNVASGYLNSPEFQVKYGNADQATFINLLYKNILGRAADSGGTTFINNWIAGGATREDVTLGFTESPEYIAQCATLIGNNGIHYTPIIG